MRLALQMQIILQRLFANGNQPVLNRRPIVPPPLIPVHLKQYSQNARQALRFLLQQIRLDRPFKTGFPQQIPLFVIRVERLREPVGLHQALGELNQMRRAQ